MGEYATRKSDNQHIKIGTCEMMYYLRYEDRNKVRHEQGNVDPSKDARLFFRLPFPDEDNVEVGEYKDFKRGERLYKVVQENGHEYCVDFQDETTSEDAGIMQLHNDSGLLVNVACYHGNKLPQGSKDIQPFWNGKSWFLELAHIKSMPDGSTRPTVHCRFCDHMWSYEWEEILPYLHGEMKSRLEKYLPVVA